MTQQDPTDRRLHAAMAKAARRAAAVHSNVGCVEHFRADGTRWVTVVVATDEAALRLWPALHELHDERVAQLDRAERHARLMAQWPMIEEGERDPS